MSFGGAEPRTGPALAPGASFGSAAGAGELAADALAMRRASSRLDDADGTGLAMGDADPAPVSGEGEAGETWAPLSRAPAGCSSARAPLAGVEPVDDCGG